MNPIHVDARHAKLESLSYPGVGQRMVEAVLGSVRRDALAVLRGASHAELVPGKCLPALQFTHGSGEVRFMFGDGVEAVHINTSRGSLHLSGSCEMAQRLSRFAIRALGVHHARAKNACVKEVQSLLAGDDYGQALSSSYEASSRDKHHGDGYDCGDIERGSITTEHGVLTLSSEKRLYRIGGVVGQQMDFDRHLALSAREHGRMFGPPYDPGSTSGNVLSPFEAILIPPPSAGEIDSTEATFSNDKLDVMLKLLGGDALRERIDFDKQTVRSLLAWAKKARETR